MEQTRLFEIETTRPCYFCGDAEATLLMRPEEFPAYKPACGPCALSALSHDPATELCEDLS